MIRTGVVASAAAIALAACGGHGLVPSQSVASGTDAVTPMATNPCYTAAVQPAWIFMGSCKIVAKLPAKGATVALAAYKGVTVTVKLPKPSPAGGSFALVNAVGGKAKDIKPFKGKAFLAITPKTLKSVVYVEAVNGTAGLKFASGSLVFTIKAAKFSGSSCPLSVLTGTFPKLKWFNSPFSGKISGGTMTFTVPGGALGTLFPAGLPAGPSTSTSLASSGAPLVACKAPPNRRGFSFS
jgi:hypothetical protein